MAFTEIVSDIAGVGPTASFVLGPNTMAPYAGVQMLGLTDGTSPATASKNMAEIYNLQRFERKLAIEMAGLTYDPTDDSQFVRAMQLLPNLSPRRFGTFPSVLAPVSAPSLADPATVKTNTNGEVFMYNGTAWVLVANGLFVSQPVGTVTPPAGTFTAAVYTCQRAGLVTVSGGDLCVTAGSSQNIVHYILYNGTRVAIQNVVSTLNINHASMSATVNVVAGGILTYTIDYGSTAPATAIIDNFNVLYHK